MKKNLSVLFAAGGTGGHIFPAIAIAEELEKQGISFHFITSKKGMANERLATKGFKASQLDVRGFQISKNPFRGLTNNLLALNELIAAKKQAKRLLKELAPDVILATGGYVSVPVGLVAESLKIPLIIFEPNAVPGKANKILSRKAAICAVGFKECKLARAFHSGIPVRESILKIDRHKKQKKAKAGLGVKELLVVMGGSLGSEKINQTLLNSLEKLSQREQLSIHHIVGERDWNTDADIYEEQMKKYSNYHALKFENNMEKLFEAADLFVSRAGAISLAELDVASTPCIIIPWPDAAGNHQLANAKSFCKAKKKTAKLIVEKNLTGATFSNAILKFLDAEDLKFQESDASKNRQASKLVVDLLMKYYTS